MSKTVTVIVGDRYLDTIMSIVKCYTNSYTHRMNNKNGNVISFTIPHNMVNPCVDSLNDYPTVVSVS